MKEMRERRKNQGKNRKEYYLTDSEIDLVEKYIKEIRNNN